MKLELRLEDEPVVGGQAVRGHVLVHEGGDARALTVTVRFCERSPSFRSVSWSGSDVVHEGPIASGQAIAFACEIPPFALPATQGRHGELFWEIEASADLRGLDARAGRRFDVVATRTG